MAVLFTTPYQQFFDSNGDPLTGGKIYTYAAGTSTPKATYTTAAGDVEQTNPIILDSAGRATIFISGSYKYVVKDSADATIETVDNVSAFTALAAAADSYFQSFSGDGTETAFTLSTALGTDEKAVMVFVDDGLNEYITNGAFATDTDWTKGTGWTIGSEVATATPTISTALSQTSPITLVEGQSYNLTYTVTASAGGIIPSLGGGTDGTERTAGGTYTETLIAGATQLTAFTGNAFTGTLDNITITRVMSDGFQIQNVANYTLSGTTLTFASAPATGTNNIMIFAPSELVGAASASAEAAAASAADAAADAILTAADVVSTNADVVLTNADVVLTNADVVTTNADVVTTNADAATTTQDAIDTAADVVTTNADAATTTQDAIDTAADVVTTNADAATTTQDAIDTAADAVSTAADAASAALSAAQLQGTSTTSLLIEVASKIFTTQAGKQFDAGAWLLVTSDANPVNYMHGQVTSYSGTTLTLNVTNIGGSGTLADWTIDVSGTRGATGAAGSVTDGDKGDIVVSGTGTVWTADSTMISGKADTVVTASDTILFGDATDTDALKKDTVQGILDLADAVGWNNGGHVANKYYLGIGYSTSGTTYVTSANVIVSVPYVVGADETFTRIGIEVTTSIPSSNMRLGIYNFANGVPTDLILDAGTVATDSLGIKEITISQFLSRGVYALVILPSHNPVIRKSNFDLEIIESLVGADSLTSGTQGVAPYRSFTYGALPDPSGITTLRDSSPPAIWLRKV